MNARVVTLEQAQRITRPRVVRVPGVKGGRPLLLPGWQDAAAVVMRMRKGSSVEAVCAETGLTPEAVLYAVRWGLVGMPGG